jgi:hypothetical protein
MGPSLVALWEAWYEPESFEQRTTSFDQWAKQITYNQNYWFRSNHICNHCKTCNHRKTALTLPTVHRLLRLTRRHLHCLLAKRLSHLLLASTFRGTLMLSWREFHPLVFADVKLTLLQFLLNLFTLINSVSQIGFPAVLKGVVRDWNMHHVISGMMGS